jgi:hypothetical protein
MRKNGRQTETQASKKLPYALAKARGRVKLEVSQVLGDPVVKQNG